MSGSLDRSMNGLSTCFAERRISKYVLSFLLSRTTTDATPQLPAHSLTIDRKIRVRLEPKTSIAMKLLRTKFNHLFAAKMKNPGATMSAEDAMWLELIKESLVTKAEAPRAKAEQVRKVKISLVKH